MILESEPPSTYSSTMQRSEPSSFESMYLTMFGCFSPRISRISASTLLIWSLGTLSTEITLIATMWPLSRWIAL